MCCCHALLWACCLGRTIVLAAAAAVLWVQHRSAPAPKRHTPGAGAHRLVPLYACHLRAGLRHTTYHIFFEQLLAQVGSLGAYIGGRLVWRLALDGDRWHVASGY